MKDAIQAMMETMESSRSHVNAATSKMVNPDFVRGPPRKYEKLIEKLESDVRGHIRVRSSWIVHV